MKKFRLSALSLLLLACAPVKAEEAAPVTLSPDQIEGAVKDIYIDGSGISKEMQGLEKASDTMRNQLQIKWNSSTKDRLPLKSRKLLFCRFLTRFRIR